LDIEEKKPQRSSRTSDKKDEKIKIVSEKNE